MKNLLSLFLIFLSFTGCNEEGNPSDGQQYSTPEVTVNASYDVVVERGIAYAEGLSHQDFNSASSSSVVLELDAYVPQNDSQNRPAILLIHGGAFVMGARDVAPMVNLANYFAARGWVAFSMSYRLADAKGTVPVHWLQFAQNNLTPATATKVLSMYPAHRDARAALRWLFANSDNYQINTDFITVGGGSAGAVVATAMGVTEPEDFLQEITVSADPTLSGTYLNQVPKVHTILDFWGSAAGANLIRDLEDLNRFDANDAPIMIVHGTEDATVDFRQAEILVDAYTMTGVDFAFYPLQARGHSPWDATVNGKTLSELSFDFIVEQQALRKR